MWRIFLIFFIIILFNFIKKMAESARMNRELREGSTPPDKKETLQEQILEKLLSTKDDFLKEFQQSPTEEGISTYQEEQRLSSQGNIIDIIEQSKKTFSDKAVEQAPLHDYRPIDFSELSSLSPEEMPEGMASAEILHVRLDFSHESIQSAIIMKEVLSPPLSLRERELDLFSSVV